MVRERMYQGFGLLLALTLAGVISTQLGPLIPIAVAAANLPGTALDQLNTAAAALDSAMAKDGSGLTFEAVQRNTLHTKPGGPQIPIVDETNRTKVVALVDDAYVNAVVTRGAVTSDAFWMYMRRGPAEGQAADFDRSDPMYSVIERDGKLWRNDGDGWYPIQADESPGMGIDPASARNLPGLLRSLSKADSLQPTLFDGKLLLGIHGSATPDDYPGVVASDGKSFTDATVDITFWLDDSGRLSRLEAHGRNLNQETWDLVSDVVITFGYGATGDPPDPTPTMAPQPLPTSEPESSEVQP